MVSGGVTVTSLELTIVEPEYARTWMVPGCSPPMLAVVWRRPWVWPRTSARPVSPLTRKVMKARSME